MEEDNLSSSNICTTVDAFEQFQAVATFEEDEYITLSDIVPPQPAIPDLSHEINEIPYDNEIVLTSTHDDDALLHLPCNNIVESSRPQSNADQNKSVSVNDYAAGAESYHNEKKTKSLGNTNKNQKVGRRKAKSNETHSYLNDSEILETENITFKDNQAVQDNVLSTTVGKNCVKSSNDTQPDSKYPRRTRRERIPNISKYPLITEIRSTKKTMLKSRGRPKKTSLENSTISEPDSTNLNNTPLIQDNVSYQSEENLVDNEKNENKKGRYRTKSSLSRPSGEKIQPNDALDNKTESTSGNAHSKDIKKPTRKGRRKKKKETKENPVGSISDSLEYSDDNIVHTSKADLSKNKCHIQDSLNETGEQNGLTLNNDNRENVIVESLPDHHDAEVDTDNDADDICLSKLKASCRNKTGNLGVKAEIDILNTSNENGETSAKRNSKMPVKADYEYDIDKIIKESSLDDEKEADSVNESLLVEDTSKRCYRRKVKQILKYDEGSDEDPFANMESSEDEEPIKRKKWRYNRDDEYIPRAKRDSTLGTSSDSDIDEKLGERQKRKRASKTSNNQSPKKRGRKSKVGQNEESITLNENSDEYNIEPFVVPSLNKLDDEPLSMKPPAEAWATSNEFENFIAQKIQGSNLKIKKVSSRLTKDNTVTPIEIPVLEQNGLKKPVEISTQTTHISTTSTGMQTCLPYDIPMKTNMLLTTEQSLKACEFLNSVVKTTAELGQLMKEKSEDFMKKKINPENVTDTFKMDYCVRKSFLLFKLARHNLVQMEDDLGKQYDEFLKVNNLSSCREKIKDIKPKEIIKTESDSDCEIVDVKEVPKAATKTETGKLNPKTVFLNKELSIKIAKKVASTDKNVNIKGRHTVWINDSVMVKKVKTSQSFLAQDSRNKKPPDYVTEKMVSDFFEDYYRQKALAVCAPYVNTEWSRVHTEYACHYFIKSNDFEELHTSNPGTSINTMENNASTFNGNCDIPDNSYKKDPKSLSFLCAAVICHCLRVNNVKAENQDIMCNLTDGKKEIGPLSLFRLCCRSFTFRQQNNASKKPSLHNNIDESVMSLTVLPLKSLCYKRISDLMSLDEEPISDDGKTINGYEELDKYERMDNTTSSLWPDQNISDNNNHQEHTNNNHINLEDILIDSSSAHDKKNVTSLFSLCVTSIQNTLGMKNKSLSRKRYSANQIKDNYSKTNSPKPLKCMAFKIVKHCMYRNELTNLFVENNISWDTHETFDKHEMTKDFTINCANTLSEEVFHSLDAPDEFPDDNDDYDYEPEIAHFDDDNEAEDNEWASHVQMQELRSCVTPPDNLSENECDGTVLNNVCTTINPSETEFTDTNVENSDQYQNNPELNHDSNVLASQIKLEPLDDLPENVDSSIVKTEPINGLDGMAIIPDSIVTKSEMIEQSASIEAEDLAEKENASYDVNTFEQFVRYNKMIRSMDDEDDSDSDRDGMFTQTGLRIRRQHEPDNDAENDVHESLLIPQTYEPLHIDNAKGVLMESSSDENMDGGAKKAKKKTEKKKTKPKKGKETPKNSNLKDSSPAVSQLPVKEKLQSVNEVAVLTRKMRGKIRQEEKKIESSDSDSDSISLSLRRDKNRVKDNEKNSSTKNLNQGESSKVNKNVDDEIQCNNVDSTQQVLEGKDKTISESNLFTGFSAIDQNEISSYQKYMKFVYDKIVPTDGDSDFTPDNNEVVGSESNQDSNTLDPVISPDQPVELLECEPTMPIFDDENTKPVKHSKKTIGKKRENTSNKAESNLVLGKPKLGNKSKLDNEEPKFTERDGWHLYSINSSDPKLYQKCQIPLEKLPESFVETYFEYHDITDRDNVDKEVDRLINLQSLNRASGVKDLKNKTRQKSKSSNDDRSISGQNSRDGSRGASPANSDRLDELTPSEDEGANVDDELPPPVPLHATENCIAKSSLMNENESDSEDGGAKKIKQEQDADGTAKAPESKSKTKAGKSKVDAPISSENLMLTADKMMNKELTLLHAPIVLKKEVKEATPKEPNTKEDIKLKKKNTRSSMKERSKTDDDSSSEEEKQWVSTKEKLLKRIMGKKEDASVDDAKRAKLVDDFIERRGDGSSRRMSRLGGRRSRKKFLERMKQQRFLSKELYGEPSLELAPGGKRGAAAATGLFKGRRNIRKVIDKKSLQKSTVLANMEEFERKRRLSARQNQLRELLGCEEGVSVLVINDEVCLEYDFAEQRPVVTVHPFFTKVMKAHQYEGVKFMWDACFESLASIEAGHGGGGCILAHCMGLGKTLQVLALLHTVLTHPRAGMQRVLVCCPLSTVLNWVDEIHKWIGPVTNQIKVFELSKLKKTYERAYQLEDWYSGGGIFIIGYELFRSLTTLDPLIDEVRPTIINKIRTALLDPGPDIVICDEGHLLKNDCSVLAVAMSRVVTRRRIVLTGTPMQNNLREYYCMVNFVKPNLLGTYSEYSNRFENPIMNGQHRDSREEDIKLMKARTHILHKVLEGCLQRQEASVLYPYLPKKHEYTVFIPLTKCQWDLYKHYVHHYTKKSKQSVLKDFHILQKIWSHPQVLHNFQIKSRDDARKKEIKPEKLEDDLALEDKEDIKPTPTETWWLQYLADGDMLNSLESSNKFVAVFRILHECIALGDKVLIFSTSLFCLDALEYFLRQINGWSLGQEYYRLDGSVPAEVRQKWVREFNAENNLKTKLFLISTRAGCLGLNMTSANRVIILDTSWNPAHDIQSIFRVYRFGQKKDCYIYRLVAMGTMEQKIYERSVTKQAVACRVVDEQQIDRHYNMAELTELYRFDEHGSGVAGGVAVGVGDVALLRVARDAAVHAVHEHDSLLRGSSEQGLPEHERAAAWMQFQQEHSHKQMQNDLEANAAVRTLKKLQQQEMVKDQPQQKTQVLKIKTEDAPVHEFLPEPKPGTGAGRGRGGWRGRGRRGAVVQCRIPIKADSDQPSTSHTPDKLNEDHMVQQISNLLIKHNFTQSAKGPKQIQDLVAKVKRMVQSGKPLALGNKDELTASIASVLLQRQGEASPSPMPALTDIKANSPPPPPVGRRRRAAALAAEMQFELDAASQDSPASGPVIELDDDDDWLGAATDFHTAPEHRPKPKNSSKANESSGPSILLSDDELPVSPVEKRPPDSATSTPASQKPAPASQKPAPASQKPVSASQKPAPASQKPALASQKPALASQKPTPASQKPAPASQKPAPASQKSVLATNKLAFDSQKSASSAEKAAVPNDEPAIPLHPSLLTNQNFIKIVAHTYLAGNPMLDEDAATLAAQYSTFRLLKETESSGKVIDSGPIYDIAIKILGVEVLRKLQTADPKSKDRGEGNVASTKLIQALGQDSAAPDAARKRPGPKSRVKPIKEEPAITPTPTNARGPVPVTLMRGPSAGASAPRDECILPDDDDDVRCLSEPTAPPPLKTESDSRPRVALSVRVTAGGSTSMPFHTICLDSDEDDPPAPAPVPPTAPAPPRPGHVGRKATPMQLYSQSVQGPVPVALTGPDSQPLLLPRGPDPIPTSALPLAQPQPRPRPEGLLFEDALTPIRLDPAPVPASVRDSKPVPISLTGPGERPVPISLSGPGFQAVPISSGSEPVAAAPVPSGVRALRLTLQPGQTAHHFPQNIFLVPTADGKRMLTHVPAAQVPPNIAEQVMTCISTATSSQSQHQPTTVKTMCKPGDILRLTKTGQLEVLNSDVVHTIDDDDDQSSALTQKTAGPAQKTAPTAQKTATPAQITAMLAQKTAALAQITATPKQKTAAPTLPVALASKKPTATTSTVSLLKPRETPSPLPATPSSTRRARVPSSSSSSSSSDSEGDADPLSILKDVVHIQAPARSKPVVPPPKKTNASSKPPVATNNSKTAAKPPQQSKSLRGKDRDDFAQKLNTIVLSMNKNKTEDAKSGARKAELEKTSNKNATLAKIKESIDLTAMSAFSMNNLKAEKQAKILSKDGPSTVVGTSKNIVLDGKSKSLTNKSMVDLTGEKSVQVTNVKTIPPAAASKQKPMEKKRPAPPAELGAPKKKKTALMTLKDFDIDIDDIDDIIELD